MPITIRNVIVFHRFIPVSIQAGLSLVEGIGDYDSEGQFGMPRSDRESLAKDIEWSSRSDYNSLWTPDGIDRDQLRLKRGLDVVRKHPGWFLRVMVRRAGSMFRYNGPGALPYPEGTCRVPPVTADVPYSHPLNYRDRKDLLSEADTSALFLGGDLIETASPTSLEGKLVWSLRPAEFLSGGSLQRPGCRVRVTPDSQSIVTDGDNCLYGDQFASAAFELEKDHDYLLDVPVSVARGLVAIKVTSRDRRISLAAASLPVNDGHERKLGNNPAAPDSSGSYVDLSTTPTAAQAPRSVKILFATGTHREVRLVVSNNGKLSDGEGPSSAVGTASVFDMGPTALPAGRYPRRLVRGIQRNIYTTGRLVLLIGIGALVLCLARRFDGIAALTLIPVYFVLLQSPLHTEYRYILAMHYTLFALAGLGIVFLSSLVWQTIKSISLGGLGWPRALVLRPGWLWRLDRKKERGESGESRGSLIR